MITFSIFLLGKLNRKYAKSAGYSISQQIKLEASSDCALVYNPLVSMKNPKLVLYIPSLFESGGDHAPHSIMMAVIANMILDQDPEFEALIAKKVSQHIETFEKEDVFIHPVNDIHS